MLTTRPFFFFFFVFFFLFLHLSCFTPSHRRRRSRRNSLITSFFSFFGRLFTSSVSLPPPPPPPPSLPSHSSSARSFLSPNSRFTADFHPCSTCGEVFGTTPLLDLHRSLHHPLSELPPDDENIVRIIFNTGWPDASTTRSRPNIRRILKIHNSPKITSRFEEYRERVKARAAAANPRRRDERCVADGNELLRFQCTTFVCDLDSGGGGACGRRFCSVCGIVRRGFSPKMDGISTLPTSYAAHISVPEEMEKEFKFMNVKRAVLVSRVVAGRIGYDPCESEEDEGFDSVAGRSSGGGGDDEDEILVFNPRAVLPCFVIVYTTL